ncbi:hypothetical protein QTP70_009416 [Hemibagrus guttatus]|uniref:Uncharacterized protein n=1 Tax=Hemibagrus guttatus TaxID=175788 RepID=A0AAE0URK9_9TELE|nr:hypothetical protein QTP70_009416 [Hemibagrus guttatus]
MLPQIVVQCENNVRNVIKKFAKHGIVKNLPGRRGKRKIDKRTLRMLVRMVEKTPRLTSKDLKGQPGTVWDQGFNKYYTLHTKPSRASWAKAKENTIAEEKS